VKWSVLPVPAAELPVDWESAVAREAESLALALNPSVVPGCGVKEELERVVETMAEHCVIVDQGWL
jgi:hypothetical protein